MHNNVNIIIKESIDMYDNNLVIQKVLEVNMLDRHSISLQTDNKYCSLLSCRIEGESLFFHKDYALQNTGENNRF